MVEHSHIICDESEWHAFGTINPMTAYTRSKLDGQCSHIHT